MYVLINKEIMKIVIITLLVILSIIGSIVAYALQTNFTKDGVSIPNWFIWFADNFGGVKNLPKADQNNRLRKSLLVQHYKKIQ